MTKGDFFTAVGFPSSVKKTSNNDGNVWKEPEDANAMTHGDQTVSLYCWDDLIVGNTGGNQVKLSRAEPWRMTPSLQGHATVMLSHDSGAMKNMQQSFLHLEQLFEAKPNNRTGSAQDSVTGHVTLSS